MLNLEGSGKIRMIDYSRVYEMGEQCLDPSNLTEINLYHVKQMVKV